MTDKEKQKTLNNLISKKREEVFILEMQVKFFNRKLIAGTSTQMYEQMLGQSQAGLRAGQEMLAFYEKELEEF